MQCPLTSVAWPHFDIEAGRAGLTGETILTHVHRISLGICFLLQALSCRAEGFVNAYEVPLGVSSNVIGNQLTHEILNRTLHHWDEHAARTKGSAGAKVRIPASPKDNAAKLLASDMPREQARGAEMTYKQAFDYHEAVIKKFKLPTNDIGVGLASCIAGAWMAYQNKSFPDEFYLPLVQQMRELANGSAAMTGLSADERAVAYQTLAITGMLLASSQITWARNPHGAAADDLRKRMRVQGGETLTRLLHMPAEHVAIGASGIVLPARR